jgi:hypothetical protein
MFMGELEKVEDFWSAYADEGRGLRLACLELLFELRKPVETGGRPEGLRQAMPEDLDLILPVQAHLVELESEINPLDADPEGFRVRCLRRAEMGRTWVVVEGGRLSSRPRCRPTRPRSSTLRASGLRPRSGARGPAGST